MPASPTPDDPAGASPGRGPVTDPSRLFDEVAAELERAAAHARTAAQHARDTLVPRMAAHAWAARGHLLEALARLDEQAREHARRSEP